jgi:hypothetical protein
MSPRRLLGFVLPLCFIASAGCGGQFKEFAPDGKFKVQMPGTPTEKSQSAMGLTVKAWSLEEGNGAYVVSATDLPAALIGQGAAALEQQLDSAREGAMRSSGSKLTKEEKITLAGKYPGRHIEADVPSKNGKMKARIYIVGNRLYQVLAVGTESWMSSGDVTKFLESLELTGEPAQPAPQK